MLHYQICIRKYFTDSGMVILLRSVLWSYDLAEGIKIRRTEPNRDVAPIAVSRPARVHFNADTRWYNY